MNKIMFSFAALAAALLSGCTNVATFDYNGAPGAVSAFQERGSGRKTVAVMPFLDQRSASVTDPGEVGDRGSLYLGFLPLMPFGYLIKSEPENSDDFVSLGRFHFDPRNDLANAAMISLKQSNLFANVVRANDQSQAAGADYIWRGKLLSTRYRGNMYSYCLTYFVSHIFWIIGVPSGTSWNQLHVQFELIDRASGQVVWQYDFDREDSITHWLYARVGKDASLYAVLMKIAMNNALQDLQPRLPGLKPAAQQP
ncbi:MAG: hypothetical protein IJS14_06520 [Lentisphaeria bacterium]|nr:hypothetical protein [Lentisphaeria bacterium]